MSIKITLDIGSDLAKAIRKVADTSYHADVGSNIRKAFGIDFSKVLKQGVFEACPCCLGRKLHIKVDCCERD